jgi:hypothetical protein
MASKPTIFHSDSRKPFEEETPVIDAAERAASKIADKYGKAAGGAVFKNVIMHMHVPPSQKGHSAVELMRRGGVTVLKSRREADVTAVAQVRGTGMAKKSAASALNGANSEAARRLRALGFPTK